MNQVRNWLGHPNQENRWLIPKIQFTNASNRETVEIKIIELKEIKICPSQPSQDDFRTFSV